MKKAIVISLTVLILFNTMGFYVLLLGLRYKARKEIVQRLDTEQYRQEETFTLKVPFSLPYNASGEDFERVDGEIEYGGEFYRLVKQRLADDTLYIVCIKDIKSKHIKLALADYVKTFTDKPVDRKSQGKIHNTFIKDFLPSSFSLSGRSNGWNHSVTESFYSLSFFDSRAVPILGPPPEA